jgi:hypothetical protein
MSGAGYGAAHHIDSFCELGEVVADVAKDVLDLASQEDHRDDDGDGDDCDDERVLNEALSFVFTNECQHLRSPFLTFLVAASVLDATAKMPVGR